MQVHYAYIYPLRAAFKQKRHINFYTLVPLVHFTEKSRTLLNFFPCLLIAMKRIYLSKLRIDTQRQFKAPTKLQSTLHNYF